jgi:hypothetical protein
MCVYEYTGAEGLRTLPSSSNPMLDPVDPVWFSFNIHYIEKDAGWLTEIVPIDLVRVATNINQLVNGEYAGIFQHTSILGSQVPMEGQEGPRSEDKPRLDEFRDAMETEDDADNSNETRSEESDTVSEFAGLEIAGEDVQMNLDGGEGTTETRRTSPGTTMEADEEWTNITNTHHGKSNKQASTQSTVTGTSSQTFENATPPPPRPSHTNIRGRKHPKRRAL